MVAEALKAVKLLNEKVGVIVTSEAGFKDFKERLMNELKDFLS